MVERYLKPGAICSGGAHDDEFRLARDLAARRCVMVVEEAVGGPDWRRLSLARADDTVRRQGGLAGEGVSA